MVDRPGDSQWSESDIVVPDPIKTVLVSVVLACRNAEKYLARQLEALASQTCSEQWELVISDNGSTDRSRSILEEFRPRFYRLVVIDSSTCVGPGAARNAGVRTARGDRILFCDADDEVGPGWLAAMSDALELDGLIAARLDHHLLNEPWTRTARNPQPGLLETEPRFLPYTFCAALGVRRSVHESIGGFDESYREAGEDRDYCYRAQLAGTPLVLVANAVVHYRHRQTALGMYRQARGYGSANVRLYRDYRHLGLGRPPMARAVGSWALMPARLLLALTTRHRFANWMARLGWRQGRLQASIRYRVWAL
jgi:glycosyltransferase involved in cell wall biosynthesis